MTRNPQHQAAKSVAPSTKFASAAAGAQGTDGLAIEAHGLCKTYGAGDARVVALDDVAINVPRGQFVAVMGPSGSGKSTLLHVLAGLDAADSGTVRLGGRALTGLSEKQVTRLRRDHLGFVFQQFNLLPVLTAAENMLLPLRLAARTVDPAWFETVVEAVGMSTRLDHRPTELSGGQQQRVAVGRALMSRPEVIFADEPTGNLDSRAGANVLTLLRRCVDEFGQTVVMVTHDPSAATVADTTVFLADGRIVSALERPDSREVLDELSRITDAATVGQGRGQLAQPAGR